LRSGTRSFFLRMKFHHELQTARRNFSAANAWPQAPPFLHLQLILPVSSFERLVVRAPRPFASPGALWKAAAAVLAITALIVARACGYDFYSLLAYPGYFAAFVALPGVVALYALNRRPLSLATALALAIPTGFAIEIFSYLGLAAMEIAGAVSVSAAGVARGRGRLVVATAGVTGARPRRRFARGPRARVGGRVSRDYFCGREPDVCGVAARDGHAVARDFSRLGLPREPGGGDQTQLAARRSEPLGHAAAISLLHDGARGGGFGHDGRGAHADLAAPDGGAARGRDAGAGLCAGPPARAEPVGRRDRGAAGGDGGRSVVCREATASRCISVCLPGGCL
jgi:hypothetical protein